MPGPSSDLKDSLGEGGGGLLCQGLMVSQAGRPCLFGTLSQMGKTDINQFTTQITICLHTMVSV